MKNELLEEVWRIKDEMAGNYGFNIDKIVQNLKNREKEHRKKVVNFSKDVKKAA